MMEIEKQTFRVFVNIRGADKKMSLTKQGNLWTLAGNGLYGEARTEKDVFVSVLGIVDGKKAAERWNICVSKGGEKNGRKNG